MKALLSLRLTVDYEDRNSPIYNYIKLYNEDGEFVWRIDSELGDECGLPRPKSVRQAKIDARAVYTHSSFKPNASWF